MKFSYQARTPEGQIQSGVVEASSKEAALSLLQTYGLYVTSLEEEKKPPFFLKRIEIFQRVSRKDIALFSRQLAILFKSNVPVIESLQTIAKQMKKRNFKEKIFKIAEKVEGGTPLSQALGFYPQIFSPFYTSVVKSGEAAGKLSEVLSYLADHTEREYNFYSKVIGAMVYPIFVFFVFTIILALMVTLVIPKLTQILTESGQALPLVTKAVIKTSDFLRDWWWLILLFLLGIFVFISQIIKTKQGKIFVDEFSLKLPLFGDFIKKIYLTRIAENLSTLISAGLPIMQALEITGEIAGNDVYRNIVLKTRDGVKRGELISVILSRYPESFPPLFIQMATVGEKTGRLDSTLMNIVNFYQGEVERTLDGFVKLLEPILIIILGLIVAGLIASVLLPLYRIQIV